MRFLRMHCIVIGYRYQKNKIYCEGVNINCHAACTGINDSCEISASDVWTTSFISSCLFLSKYLIEGRYKNLVTGWLQIIAMVMLKDNSKIKAILSPNLLQNLLDSQIQDDWRRQISHGLLRNRPAIIKRPTAFYFELVKVLCSEMGRMLTKIYQHTNTEDLSVLNHKSNYTFFKFFKCKMQIW